MYKKLIINEQTSFQNEVINNFYCVTNLVMIGDVKDLKATYNLFFYKSKQHFETNVDWFFENIIFEKEFEPTFLDGDIFEKIAEEIKIYFQQKNNWLNITIE